MKCPLFVKNLDNHQRKLTFPQLFIDPSINTDSFRELDKKYHASFSQHSRKVQEKNEKKKQLRLIHESKVRVQPNNSALPSLGVHTFFHGNSIPLREILHEQSRNFCIYFGNSP